MMQVKVTIEPRNEDYSTAGVHHQNPIFPPAPPPGDEFDIEKQVGIVLVSTGKKARCYHKANCEIVTNPRRKGNFSERKPCKYCFKGKHISGLSDSDSD